MATTITGKLNKAANKFQAGDSTGFGISLGVQYYDRTTKQKEWTNYKAVIFARAEGQINFYENALVDGAIIEVTGINEKIDVYEGQNGQSISIELLDAKLGYVAQGMTSNQRAVNEGQQASQQQNSPPGGMDDDIPFAPLGREYI